MLHLLHTKVVQRKADNFVGGVGAFNPNFDGNALAWYDGNAGLSNTVWEDQGSGGHDIVFSNTPTITLNATPLRDAVLFDGIDQIGTISTPVNTQPYSFYIVSKLIMHANLDTIMDDGVLTNRKIIRATGASPTLAAGVDGSFVIVAPSPALDTYAVLIGIANGATSLIRTNLETGVALVAGVNQGAGITIGAALGSERFTICEVGYIIVRTGADSTAIQNHIINGLKAACGLTF